MTQLSKASFLSKYATIFADNVSRNISEEDMRDFRQDIADSFDVIGNVEVLTDTTKTLGAESKTYFFTGSGVATWTLPSVSGNTGIKIKIKNKTSHDITVQRAGSDNIFTLSAVTSITVGEGEIVTLINDGTNWTTI